VTQLLPGTVYEVQVRAKNIAGWSAFTEVVEIKTPDAKKEEKDAGEEEESKETEEEKAKRQEAEKKAKRKASIL
jgi:hypothetical protein